MENNSIKFDYKVLSILNLLKFKCKPDKIEEEKDSLYKYIIDYLKENGVNSVFLDKPSIIERVKKIIFENLLLGEKTKFDSNGALVEKNEESKQILSVMNNGSILFFREYNGEKRVTLIDELDGNIVCRYFEYENNETLKSERQIIIDEFGFDKKIIEIGMRSRRKI